VPEFESRHIAGGSLVDSKKQSNNSRGLRFVEFVSNSSDANLYEGAAETRLRKADNRAFDLNRFTRFDPPLIVDSFDPVIGNTPKLHLVTEQTERDEKDRKNERGEIAP
jgi:hypothetical protein